MTATGRAGSTTGTILGSDSQPADSAQTRTLPVRPFWSVLLGLLILIGSGVVHGMLTHRWGTPAEMQRAALDLEHIPKVIGRWNSDAVAIPQDQLRMADAQGVFSRRYTDRETGQSLHVLILCGAAGPVSVHPPTVCLTSVGFHLLEPARAVRLKLGKTQHAFQTATFTRHSNQGIQSQQVFWSWSANGIWSAPDNPRMTYAREPVLYKMYVTRALGGRPAPVQDEVVIPFLQLLLPRLQKVLFESND